MHTSMKISHPHSLADGGEKRPRADPGSPPQRAENYFTFNETNSNFVGYRTIIISINGIKVLMCTS